jgi:hypothetical protein
MSPSTCEPSAPLRDSAALAELVHDLPESATTDPQVLAALSTDASRATAIGLPCAAVRARTTHDVSRALAWASRWRVPVSVRGAGTRLAGGAVAYRSGHCCAGGLHRRRRPPLRPQVLHRRRLRRDQRVRQPGQARQRAAARGGTADHSDRLQQRVQRRPAHLPNALVRWPRCRTGAHATWESSAAATSENGVLEYTWQRVTP